VRVWTSHAKLAERIAREYGLRIDAFNGEREVYVPTTLCDKLLPRFGAKVKRNLSEGHLKVLARNRDRFKSKKESTTGGLGGHDSQE